MAVTDSYSHVLSKEASVDEQNQPIAAYGAGGRENYRHVCGSATSKVARATRSTPLYLLGGRKA